MLTINETQQAAYRAATESTMEVGAQQAGRHSGEDAMAHRSEPGDIKDAVQDQFGPVAERYGLARGFERCSCHGDRISIRS